MSQHTANKVFNSYHRYFIFMMMFALLLVGKLNAQNQQNICLEDAMPKAYKVDWEENAGEGTIGSTYTWEILEENYNSLIQATTTSGNQIEINWTTVPVGTYTLVVTETTDTGCFNQEELVIILENCDCDNPVSVNIAEVEPICEGEAIQLSVEITNASTVQWSRDGDGVFDDSTSFTPVYTPGVADIANGSVMIYVVTEDPDGVCEAGSASVELNINGLLEVDMSSVEVHHCVGSNYDLPTAVGGVDGTWQNEAGDIVTQLNTSTIDDDLVYAFFPEPGQGCYLDSTLSFVIEALGDLSFEGLPLENVCHVADLPLIENLPANSTEGISGVWAQVDNLDGTYSYSFAPSDSCYNEFSFVVTLTPAEDTVFDYIDSSICDATDLPEVATLDSQDINGVTGTWAVSQVDDVYTYTFTPNADCYNEFSFVVTVTASVDTVFDYTDSSVCDATEIPDVVTLDSQDNNGVTGTWSVSQVDDIYTYTFTPDADCYNVFSFVITVTASVDTVFEYSDSSVCDVAELPEVSTLDLQDNNGVAGTWAVSQVDDVYTYTFTPDGDCYNEFSFVVTLTLAEDTVFDYADSSVCDAANLSDVATLETSDNNGVAGIWTVSQVDDVYTYTFTPDADCYNVFSFVVTLTPAEDTVFDYTDSSVCNATELPDVATLDTQDNNGIAGTWSVNQVDEVNTYTFTPDVECYNEFSFTVTLSASVDTVFNYTDSSVCDAAELPDVATLETSDNNGVAGTWSVNQVDDIYTYTFTPNADCYNEFSFTVTLSASVDTVFDYTNSAVCDAAELPEVSTLDSQDNNGVAGTWTFDQVDDVYTYTFTPNAECYNEFSFVVNVTAAVDTVFDYTDSSVCDATELPDVSILELQDNNGITGTWSVSQVDDVYTYTFTPTDSCYNEFSFTVTLTASGDTLFDYTDIAVCDVTELPEISTLDSQDNNGVAGTWSVNQVDDVYTYTFTPTGGCYNEFSFVVTVTSSVDTVFTYTDSAVCDATELPEVGGLQTQDNNGVAGTWSVAQSGDVYTYTFTPTDPCYNEFSFTITISGSVDTVFTYTEIAVCNATELPEVSTLDPQDNNGVDGTWEVVQTGDDYTYTFTPTGGCYNEFSFVVTVTSSVDTVFTYTDFAVCDVTGLPEVSTLGSQDNNGVEGTWAVAQAGDDYTYTFMPTDPCYNEFSFTVTVSASVDTVFDYTDSFVCDVTDLPEVSTLDSQDNNGVDGTWSVNQLDDVYTYTFTPTGGCYNAFSFVVAVTSSVDTVFTYTDTAVCDVTDLPDVATLDLQDNNGVAGTWSVNQVDDVYTYTFTPTDSCYNEFSFTVTVTAAVDTEFDYNDSSVCDIAELPEVSTLDPQDNNGVDGTWSVNQVDDVYTYTFTPTDTCYNEFSFTVTVSASVDTVFDYTDSSICDASGLPDVATLDTIDNNGVTGTWSVNQVDEVNTYTFTPDAECYNEFSFTVTVTAEVDTVFDYTDSSVCDATDLPEVGDLDSQDNNGVTGTWSVNQVEDVYIYTFTPDAECYNEFSFTVTLSASVDTVFDYTDSSVCDATELPDVATLNTQDNNGIAGAWSVSQVDDIYTYTFTPDAECYNEFSFTVTVTAEVDTVFDYTDSSVCDAVNLPEIGELNATYNNGLTGTWSVSQVDDIYTYTFTPDADCYNEFSFTITISASVDTEFDYIDSSICDVSGLPDVATLDAQDNNGIVGTWTVNQVDDVYTYTFTPDGDCYNEFSFAVTLTASVDTAFDYTDLAVCDAADLPEVGTLDSQDINGVTGTWSVNQVDEVYTYTFTSDADCYNEFSFTVTISGSVETEFDYSDSSICDVAELPDVATLDSQDNNGVAGTWAVAQVDEVYTYTFTPTDSCYNEFSFVVTINASVDTVFDYTDSSICDVTDLPDVATLDTQDNNGVAGTWSVNQVDEGYTYTFTPDADCYNHFSFVVTLTASVDAVFAYEDSSVCDASELPDVSILDSQDNNGIAGAWSVNQVDDIYTYTFTPDAECYNEFSFVVTVLASVDTVFDYTDSSVCEAANLPEIGELNATDNNGIAGTWSVNQVDEVYTYTFTPDSDCYNEFSFAVSVSASVDTVFDYTDSSVCDATELPDVATLNTQDNNGVVGTWAVNQVDDVYTYTFTPDADCYNEFSFVISVTTSVDTVFDYTDSSVCDVAELPDVSTLELQDNNGITGTWTVNQVDDVYTYTFTPNAECYNEFSFVVTLTVTVDIVFDYVDLYVCDVADLPEVGDLDTQDNNGVAGTWAVAQTGDDYTYTFTPSGGCYNAFSFVVTVTASVDTVFDYVDSSICDVAELPNVGALDTQDNNGVVGTWSVNQVDDIYTYTFIPDAECYNEFSFTITISASVDTEFSYVDSSVCDATELPDVGDLETSDNNGVTGTWTVNQVDDVYTYTFTPDADCYNDFSFVVTITASVDTVFDYTDSSVCDATELPDVATLDAQDDNGIDGTWTINQTGEDYTYTFTPTDTCYNEFSFTVTISGSVDTVFTYTDSAVCDVAELPDVATLDTSDNNGVTGTWSVAQTGDVYTYTFTPTDSCYNEFSFTVAVSASVDTVFDYVDSSVCNATELPDVATLDIQDNNGVAGTWSVNQVDEVYAYTFTPDADCYNEFSFVVTVTASVDTIFDYSDSSVCDATDLPEVGILNAQDNNGVAGTWSVSQVDDIYTYTFTPDADCYIVFSFVVTVTASVDTIFDYTDSSVCDVSDLPDVATLDSQDNNGIVGTWNVNQVDDVYTYTFTPDAECYNEFSFVVNVTAAVDTIFDYTDSSICDAADLPEVGELNATDNNGVDGTWAVAQTGDVYTYTFTPTDSCYNEFSFTVEVSASVDTEFSYFDSSVCDATELPDVATLDLQDNNGVAGTWAVAQVDDIYTYTFTPDAECYNEFIFTVTISDSVDTVFTYTDSAVCDAAELPEVAALDTSDNNGVAGTWSVNQVDEVYAYTFTPDADCYNEFSFTVTVTASVDTVFDYTDSSICDTSELPDVGDLDTQDNNGVDGTWAVAQTGDVYTYTFTPDADCYNVFSFVVTVTASVDTMFDFVDSSVCDATELLDVSTLDTTDNNGVTGTWSVSQVDDVYTYTFTPNAECYNEFSFTVSISTSVDTVFDYTDSSVCDVANLPEIGELNATDNNGLTGTWSVNQVDEVYTYTFRPDSDCYNVFSFVVTLTASVDTVFAYEDSSVCDVAELPDVSILDSQDNNGVSGIWTVNQVDEVNTYTFTPDADCYNDFSFVVTLTASVDAVFDYTDSSVCDAAELPEVGELNETDNNGIAGIWTVNQVDDVYTYTFTPDAECYNVFSFVITVTTSVDTVFDYTDSSVCDVAELPDVSTLELQDNNGITGTWTVNQVDEVYTYTFTPNADCYSEFSFTVTLSASVDTEFSYVDSSVCDASELPDVATLDTQDNNGIAGTWSVNQVDDVYTYTFTPDADCYNEFSFIVTLSASVETVFDYVDSSICDAAELPEVGDLDTQDNNGVTGTWTVVQVDDIYTYTFTPNADCYNEFSFAVTISTSIDTVFDYIDSSICDVSDLPDVATLNAQDNNGVDGTWAVAQTGDVYTYTFTPTDSCYNEFTFVLNISDAQMVSFNALPTTSVCNPTDLPRVTDLPRTSVEGATGTWTQTNNGNQTYTYEFTLDENQGCFLGTSFTVQITDSITPEFSFEHIYCQNSTPSSLPQTSDNGITGQWLPAVINTAFANMRLYTFIPHEGQCASSLEVMIEIINCPDEDTELNIPNVLTPNNDGMNDTWFIDGLIEAYPNAEVEIYNRYNKLLYRGIGAENCAWDGTYAGRNLPTGSYWYVLKLADGNVKTGHISIIYP